MKHPKHDKIINNYEKAKRKCLSKLAIKLDKLFELKQVVDEEQKITLDRIWDTEGVRGSDE